MGRNIRGTQVDEMVAFMLIFPVTHDWDAVFATVDTGPFAGREAAIIGSNALVAAGKGESRFVSCPQPVGKEARTGSTPCDCGQQ